MVALYEKSVLPHSPVSCADFLSLTLTGTAEETKQAEDVCSAAVEKDLAFAYHRRPAVSNDIDSISSSTLRAKSMTMIA